MRFESAKWLRKPNGTGGPPVNVAAESAAGARTEHAPANPPARWPVPVTRRAADSAEPMRRSRRIPGTYSETT